MEEAERVARNLHLRRNYFNRTEELFIVNLMHAVRARRWKQVQEKFYEYGLFLERHPEFTE